VHHQREGSELPAVAAVQAQGAVDPALPQCRRQGSGLVGQDVDIQPSQPHRGGGRSGTPLPGAVLRPCRRACSRGAVQIFHGAGRLAKRDAEAVDIRGDRFVQAEGSKYLVWPRGRGWFLSSHLISCSPLV